MDGTRFDTWTRTRRSRRRALGGLLGGLAALPGWLAAEDGAAKPSQQKDCGRRKKSCGDRCIPKDQCCKDKECPDGATCGKRGCRCPAPARPCHNRCARPEGAPCAGLPLEVCCSRACDYLVGNGTCAPCEGWYCSSNADCCPGVPCHQNRCGGCLHRAVVCTPGGQPCCQSECNPQDGTPVCLSPAGGRCKYDPDCYNCYMHGQCNGTCFQGFCQW